MFANHDFRFLNIIFDTIDILTNVNAFYYQPANGNVLRLYLFYPDEFYGKRERMTSRRSNNEINGHNPESHTRSWTYQSKTRLVERAVKRSVVDLSPRWHTPVV